MSKEKLLIAINAAQLAGFAHFAAALREIYKREFGGEAR